MKESIFTRVIRSPFAEPDHRPHQEHRANRGPPRQALALQSDRQHLRDADIEAGREIELIGDHRNEHRKRDQELHRLVAENRANVEIGEKRIRPQQREYDDQKNEQDEQAPHGDRPGDHGAEGAGGAAAHDAAPRRAVQVPPDAAEVNAAMVNASPAISAATRPRLNTSAR